MFQTIDLCKDFGDSRHPVLNRININIPKGSLFGLLGPNGAGKTTLISILIGLTTKTSGQVKVNGVELERCLKDVRSITGIVPQELALYPMLSAKDNLNFFADALGLQGAIREQNMEFAITTTLLNDHLHKKIQAYSGGMKRRLNLAIGLLNQPKILFLDEPTVGIDPQTRNFILQSIKSLNQQGVTVIYTSHYMDEVQQICDHVAIIDHGTILIQDEINRLLQHQHESKLQVTFNTLDATRIQQQLLPSHAFTLVDPHNLIINTTAPLAMLRIISDQLTDPETAIKCISYGNQNLEELFLSLTGNHTRDEYVR